MRGEVKSEAEAEDFAAIDASAASAGLDEPAEKKKLVQRMVSRRNFLRGKLHNTA